MNSITTPITQTAHLYLGDLLERNLNLYYSADGRFYDPWLGKYLQPDVIGGPPLVPQAADRYQYAGNSPTGVGAASSVSSWIGTELLPTFANKVIGYQAEKQWTPALLAQAGLSSFGKTKRVWKPASRTSRDYFVRLQLSYPNGSKSWMSNQLFQPIVSGRAYLEVKTGHIWQMDEVFPGATLKEVPWRQLAGHWEDVLPSGAARWLRSGVAWSSQCSFLVVYKVYTTTISFQSLLCRQPSKVYRARRNVGQM